MSLINTLLYIRHQYEWNCHRILFTHKHTKLLYLWTLIVYTNQITSDQHKQVKSEIKLCLFIHYVSRFYIITLEQHCYICTETTQTRFNHKIYFTTDGEII